MFFLSFLLCILITVQSDSPLTSKFSRFKRSNYIQNNLRPYPREFTPQAKYDLNSLRTNFLQQSSEIVPQNIQLAGTVPQSPQLAGSVPQSIQLAGSVPQSIQLAEAVPQSPQLQENVPPSIQATGTVPQSVQLAEAVPQSTGTVPQSIARTVPQSIQFAGNAHQGVATSRFKSPLRYARRDLESEENAAQEDESVENAQGSESPESYLETDETAEDAVQEGDESSENVDQESDDSQSAEDPESGPGIPRRFSLFQRASGMGMGAKSQQGGSGDSSGGPDSGPRVFDLNKNAYHKALVKGITKGIITFYTDEGPPAPNDIEDCVGCIWIVRQVEAMIGSEQSQTIIWEAIRSAMEQARTTPIFYPVAQMMEDCRDDVLMGYQEGLTSNQICEETRFCRERLKG